MSYKSRNYQARVIALTMLLTIPAAGSSLTNSSMQSGASAGSQNPPVSDDKTLANGPGKDTVRKACTSCHAADIIAKQHFTETDWNEVVGGMIDRGAVVSDDDRKVITKYLGHFYGKLPDPK